LKAKGHFVDFFLPHRPRVYVSQPWPRQQLHLIDVIISSLLVATPLCYVRHMIRFQASSFTLKHMIIRRFMSTNIKLKPYPPTWPFTEKDFARLDESDDQGFYAMPRFVQHIDDDAITALRDYYSSADLGSTVVDICSSWVSHLPDGNYRAVVGIGMNQQELKANTILTSFHVKNLNQDPKLPMEDASADSAICNVSIDYMIHPRELLQDVYRVLKPGSKVHLAFSNRCFPTKVIDKWLSTSDSQHVQLVATFLHFSGFVNVQAFDLKAPMDPMYVVVGIKASSSL
jgi:SAM-dependent methyltransferase